MLGPQDKEVKEVKESKEPKEQPEYWIDREGKVRDPKEINDPEYEDD